jgi:hypothetical protein
LCNWAICRETVETSRPAQTARSVARCGPDVASVFSSQNDPVSRVSPCARCRISLPRPNTACISEFTDAVRDRGRDSAETCIGQPYNYFVWCTQLFVAFLLALDASTCTEIAHPLRGNPCRPSARYVRVRAHPYGAGRQGTALCVPENRKRTFSSRKIRFTFVV